MAGFRVVCLSREDGGEAILPCLGCTQDVLHMHGPAGRGGPLTPCGSLMTGSARFLFLGAVPWPRAPSAHPAPARLTDLDSGPSLPLPLAQRPNLGVGEQDGQEYRQGLGQ